MRARSRILCDHSLGMALSAIEIYNKPNFKNREQVFAILMVAAWESLLKAKIVSDSQNRLSAIYVKDDRGRYKKNRAGEPMTISLDDAMKCLKLPAPVTENLTHLTRVRDAAIHLTAASKGLPYLVFTLGSASLRNYSRSLTKWFNVGLADYNFYILPLGFSYPFKSMSIAELSREPEVVAKIIQDVDRASTTLASNDEYFLVCEIQTTLISAKKLSDATDLVGKVDANASGAIVIKKSVNPLDDYPYTWTELFKHLQKRFPNLKNWQLTEFIRERSIKGNPKYSCYCYRSKAQERMGPTPQTPVIYNHDAVRLTEEYFSAADLVSAPIA